MLRDVLPNIGIPEPSAIREPADQLLSENPLALLAGMLLDQRVR